MRARPEVVGLRGAIALVLALGVCLFAVRLAGPPDLTDNDQEGPTAYVLDVVQNGHWWVQRDAHGAIASKPPFYTWLAGFAALALGRLTRFTLYLPCALAVIGTACLLVHSAGWRFGKVAGLMAGFSVLFSQFGVKHIVLARTDALFMATVTLGALAALRAWETGRGWLWFWLAAAAASLTKGPLGLVLAGGGLLAVAWQREHVRPRTWWHQVWPGLVLYAVLVGGWFALAYAQVGEALTEKQLNRELLGHLSGTSAGGHGPGTKPFHPLAYFLARYAPWSLLALAGFWRVWRRPAPQAAERRFERFLVCWFMTGLVILMIAPHKRADLLLPLIPAAAMIAGRELAGWLAPVRPRLVLGWVGALGLVIAAAVPVLSQWKAEAEEVTTQSRAMQRMAQWIESRVPAEVPVTFAGNAMTLQFYLNRHQFHTTLEQAARLLQSEIPCFVAVADLDSLAGSLPPDTTWHVLAREPQDGRAHIHFVANQPAVVPAPEMAVGVGPAAVRLRRASLVRARWLDFELAGRGPGAEASISHTAGDSLSVGVHWNEESRGPVRERTLRPNEVWTTQPPAVGIR